MQCFMHFSQPRPVTSALEHNVMNWENQSSRCSTILSVSGAIGYIECIEVPNQRLKEMIFFPFLL